VEGLRLLGGLGVKSKFVGERKESSRGGGGVLYICGEDMLPTFLGIGPFLALV
jgi:hypothetical protein